MNSFYNREELEKIGFKKIGKNVLISRKASIYSPCEMSIGSNVRIDDFCILSGKIQLGNYIHISAYCGLFGGEEGIYISNFGTVSSKTNIYALSDDYSGEYMTNPMVSEKYRNVVEEKVVLKKHVIVGAKSLILPGVVLGEGSSFGAMTLINTSSEPWSIYVGSPMKKIRNRSKNILKFEKEFLDEVKNNER